MSSQTFKLFNDGARATLQTWDAASLPKYEAYFETAGDTFQDAAGKLHPEIRNSSSQISEKARIRKIRMSPAKVANIAFEVASILVAQEHLARIDGNLSEIATSLADLKSSLLEEIAAPVRVAAASLDRLCRAGRAGLPSEVIRSWLLDLRKSRGTAGAAEALDGEDEIPPVPKAPVSRAGDLWVLAGHRLLCGDATSAADVARLLGGVRPHLMVTDPPYGVEYDPSWRNDAGASQTRRVGKVLNDNRADWREAWALFPGEVAYVWHGALHATTVADSLISCKFDIRSQIIWTKERLVLSRGHYHWQHEPCWYAVKSGGKGNWSGDRKQTTVWPISSKAQDAETVHGTQKPVECMRRPMLNSSSVGQAVYEPFMGSSTTLIAAETCSRICLGIELDPAYVDVAVLRWQQLTSATATLEGSGETFDGLASSRLIPCSNWSALRQTRPSSPSFVLVTLRLSLFLRTPESAPCTLWGCHPVDACISAIVTLAGR